MHRRGYNFEVSPGATRNSIMRHNSNIWTAIQSRDAARKLIYGAKISDKIKAPTAARSLKLRGRGILKFSRTAIWKSLNLSLRRGGVPLPMVSNFCWGSIFAILGARACKVSKKTAAKTRTVCAYKATMDAR